MMGGGAGVDEVAVDERVAFPLLIFYIAAIYIL